MRVLIVDAVLERRRAVAELLDASCETLGAASAEVALSLLEEKSTQLVLLDFERGSAGSVDLLERLRDSGHEAVAVVFLAEEELGDAVQGLFARGADDFVLRSELTALRLRRVIGNAMARVRQRVDLERSRRALRQQLEFEARLIGVVSHDLRTPLYAIELGLEALAAEPLSDVARESLELVELSSGRAMSMVNQLLDLTMVRSSGGFPLRARAATDLFSVACDAVRELAPSWRERVRLDLRGDGRGHFDPAAMTQVLSNLLVNALRYGDADSPVELIGEGDGPDVVFSVSNAGPDIPTETLECLFGPFERGRPERGSGTGLGLGLYIVRAIVEAHQGQVHASSEHGWTSFRIELPRAPTGVSDAVVV